MPSLESLLNDLANLDAQHDLEGLRRLRQQVVDEHPDTDAAVESVYKLGLDALFRRRDMTAALDAFTTAATRKHPFWSAAARISLGLCHYHQKRTQKALFELRRVAYPETPTVHSITALTFLETIFSTQGNRDEVKRVRKERIRQLQYLVETNRAQHGNAAERGYHLFQLGLALRDQGEDRAANDTLQQAKNLGPDVLGAELYRSIVDAL